MNPAIELRALPVRAEAVKDVKFQFESLQKNIDKSSEMGGFQKFACLFMFFAECVKLVFTCGLDYQEALNQALNSQDFRRAEALMAMKSKYIDLGKLCLAPLAMVTAPWTIQNRDGDRVNPRLKASLMHMAAAKGNLELVRFFLYYAADKNALVGATDQLGNHPLYWAMFIPNEVERHKMVDLLLSTGASIEGSDNDQTALMVAAGLGDVMMVAKLSMKGAAVNVSCGNYSALKNAAVGYAKAMNEGRDADARRFKDIVLFLLDQGAQPDFGPYLSYFSDVVAARVQAGKMAPDAMSPTGTSLCEQACEAVKAAIDEGRNDNLENIKLVVKTLLEKGVIPDFGIYFSFFSEMIVPRIESGELNPNAVSASGLSLLEQAYLTRNMPLVFKLVDLGANINTVFSEKLQGQTLVHLLATRDRSIAHLRTALAKGGSVTAVDTAGNTPLHTAFLRGATGCAQVLLENGAQPTIDRLNKAGDAPLHIATRAEDTQLITLCKMHRANMNLMNKKELMPLHMAALSGSGLIVDLLCRYGADARAMGRGGNTPLHLAGSRNDERRTAVIKALFAYKGRETIQVPNLQGQKPAVADYLEAEQRDQMAAQAVGFLDGAMSAVKGFFALPANSPPSDFDHMAFLQ